jgi:hypothetical protein
MTNKAFQSLNERTIIEYIEMDNITGNILNTNNFLEIDEIINEAREMSERVTNSVWTGTIKYMLWNATGLAKNVDRIVRRMIDDEILICFVTETWQHPERQIPAVCRDTSAVCVIHPVGYERGKNGVSMLINPRMEEHPLIKGMQVLARDTVNGTYLLVQLGTTKILCVYHPPSAADDITTWLEEIIEKCSIKTVDDLILLGDFNARQRLWGDHSDNTRGNQLNEWIEDSGLTRVNTGTEPTYVTPIGHSIIDHVFTNVEGVTGEVCRPIVNVSGHRPISGIITLNDRPHEEFPAYERIKLEKLRDPEVKDLLNARLGRSISYFRSRTREALSNETRQPTNTGEAQRLMDELDDILIDTIMKPAKETPGTKLTGKRKMKFEPLSSPKLEMLEAAMLIQTDMEVNAELMKLATTELQNLRKEKFDLFTDEYNMLPAADMMKTASSMLTNRKRQLMALNSSDTSLANYRDHFASMNTNTNPSPARTTEPVILQLPSLPLFDELSPFISASSIGLILKWISWNKSPGSSGICYDVLKIAPVQVLEAISDFFKLILLTGRVPSRWKTALIVPVPKKGDLCQIQNYRPISLTEPLRKLLEHCLLKFINTKIGPSFLTQGGFRTNHCCNDMIIVLQETTLKYKSNLHTAFLDIRAAYDSVDRRILWRRCRNRGLSSECIDLLKELFDHNSGQVVVGGKRSQPFHIESGVLQGSVLSPCLYSIFIDDLARELSGMSTLKVGTAEINCILYADDIALFAECPLTLQVLLDKCADHAKRNRYRFNASKCEIISNAPFDLILDGQTLPRTNRFKYLGVEFTAKGIDYDFFVKRRCKEATASANRLIGMGMNLGGFSPSACSILYKVFIRPKLEASMCILPPLKKITDALEVSQCAILRRILRAGKTSSGSIARSLLQIPTMEFRLKWLRTRYMRRYRFIEQEHVLKLVSSEASSWIHRKISPQVFDNEVTKDVAITAALQECHNITRTLTGNQLIIEPSNRIPWFLRIKAPQYVRRPIINWILKRYPGRIPPTCANCLETRAVQDHIATCNRLYDGLDTSITPRFRPEMILSTEPPSLQFQALRNIAKNIATAVQNSIPDYDFEILHV